MACIVQTCNIMNVDKRYCQGRRIKKRKTMPYNFLVEDKECTLDDERQFKLRRFVNDVNKFVEEKNNKNCIEGNICSKKVSSEIGNKLKQNNSKPLLRRGLFQNGIQTKFYTRGSLGKEFTARLDENLQQIIALANVNDNSCPHKCKPHLTITPNDYLLNTQREHELPIAPRLCSDRIRKSQVYQNSPTPYLNSTQAGEISTGSDYGIVHLDNVDRKLYPEFTRISTLSSSHSKAIHFQNKSYANTVKKRLLDIYQKIKKEGTKEFSCSSDVHKSSVATSPLIQQPLQQSPNTADADTDDSGQKFNSIHFVPLPSKSTKQFLEETIGHISSKTAYYTPEQPQVYSSQSSFGNKNAEPFSPTASSAYLFSTQIGKNPIALLSPPDFTQVTFDGGGDRFNYFPVKPIEEDSSPEFQYFTRKMF